MGYKVWSESEDGSTKKIWVFQRNCSLTPKQLLVCYLSISVLVCSVAVGFSMAGYGIVLPFAGIELLALGVAFFVFARHATDYEKIELDSKSLRVTIQTAAKVQCFEWVTPWVRLEYLGSTKEPLLLKFSGEEVKLGRFVLDEDKQLVSLELRRALAGGLGPV